MKMPMAVMLIKVMRYQLTGASLYRFIRRQWMSSRLRRLSMLDCDVEWRPRLPVLRAGSGVDGVDASGESDTRSYVGLPS